MSICSSDVCAHLNSVAVFLCSAAGGRFSQLEGRAVQSPTVVNQQPHFWLSQKI